MLQILEGSTTKVLTSAELPKLCPEAIEYIVNLKMDPYEVWKAAINWAHFKGISPLYY